MIFAIRYFFEVVKKRYLFADEEIDFVGNTSIIKWAFCRSCKQLNSFRVLFQLKVDGHFKYNIKRFNLLVIANRCRRVVIWKGI